MFDPLEVAGELGEHPFIPWPRPGGLGLISTLCVMVVEGNVLRLRSGPDQVAPPRSSARHLLPLDYHVAERPSKQVLWRFTPPLP